MVCWLRFLKLVSDSLKSVEPNLARRKTLAIDVLKGIKEEKGHNIEKIKETIEKEGTEGLIKRAKNLKGASEDKAENKNVPLILRRKKKKMIEQER
jgi:hypothetical protein